MKKLLVAILLVLLPMAVNAAVHYDEDLDDYADKSAAESSGPWSGTSSSRITLASGAEALGGTGKCWKIDWTSSGGTIYLHLPLASHQLSAVYIRFYYKHTGQRYANSKLLKLHGVRDDDSYSNFTITGGYAGIFGQLNIGNGLGITNDSTCGYRYTLPTNSCLQSGTITHYASSDLSNTVFDGNWHYIEVYCKYNTNTGSTLNDDGEFALWVDSEDGTPTYRVTGINMRHPDNSMYFSSVSFGDWANSDYLGFYDYFDNIVISDSYIGPLDYEPSCVDTPGLCGSENDCTTAGWNWCDGTCQASACEEEPPLTPVKTSTWNVPGTVRVR